MPELMLPGLTLPVVTGLDGAVRYAIDDHRVRLEKAVEAADRPLIIGCCKELVEAIAKAVLDARGRVVGSKADFPGLINKAHEALNAQPGRDLTAASPARDIAQGAKTIATQLAQLRNSFGTGHGRIQPPHVDDELLHITLDATMLWSRWALRRLGPLIEGSLVSLLNDLRGATFYYGDLARRLVAANIPALDEADQRRLGAAVARRSVGGTFLVRGEGVVAAAFGDLAQWPEPYRIGLLEGLLLDSDGVMHATEQSVNDAASAVAALPSLAAVLEEMGATTDAAALSAQLAGTPTLRDQVAEAFRIAASRLPREHRPAWMVLARPLTLP